MDEHNTDSANRLVVTGIRFVLKVKTITIEIQESKLVNRIVDPITVRWIIETSDSSGKCLKTIKLGFRFKSFNMDDIVLPDGYFVTGVRFELLNDDHITLVVRGTKMWNDEKFWPSSTHIWFYPEIARNDPREQIRIKDYRHPAESITQNEKISHSGFNYVDLSVGIISNKHNNLPVIPFFDAKDVDFDPPSPIGGLGVFHKGTSGYGGFIAFQLIASRYTFNADSENFYFDLE
ncbi:uncharacterized protein LOC141528384 [Cotesia typhae]|uniref:uncharacterized protein LOC141528384 n=1 Tax=Cotesia typhae TaxID=2053667 RepID=UPI003D68D9CB